MQQRPVWGRLADLALAYGACLADRSGFLPHTPTVYATRKSSLKCKLCHWRFATMESLIA